MYIFQTVFLSLITWASNLTHNFVYGEMQRGTFWRTNIIEGMTQHIYTDYNINDGKCWHVATIALEIDESWWLYGVELESTRQKFLLHSTEGATIACRAWLFYFCVNRAQSDFALIWSMVFRINHNILLLHSPFDEFLYAKVVCIL